MSKWSFVWCIVMCYLISCNNVPDCDDPNTSQLVLQFMDSTFSAPQSEMFSSIRDLESGFEYFSDTTLNTAVLEVNPSTTSTGFIFEEGTNADTLVIGYRQNVLLRSEQCGPVLRFFELSILTSSFQDTLLVNNELLLNIVNVQIRR